MKRIFGVEIECTYANDNYPRMWDRQFEHCGLEFVSPLLSGERGLNAIRRLYAAIEPTVNDNCGLHVHVDIRDFDNDQKLELIRRLKADKQLFASKVHPKRLTNGFCDGDLPELSPNDSFYSYTQKLHGDRYVWVNLLSVWKHGSVEFRLHEATEDVEKVCDWVKFLVSYIENVKTGVTVTECPADVNVEFIKNRVSMLVS